MTRAAVYGTGSWGTAYSLVLADAGTDVTMWGRRAEVVDDINGGSNSAYLPDVPLPSRIRATSDPMEAADGADIVVLAVPSQTLRDNLTTWGSAIPSNAAVVSLMKGVELGTTKRMSEVIEEVGQVDPDRVVIVSGPNLAKEIAAKQPAASVVAGRDERMAELVAAACAAPYFRPYTGNDVVGTEIAGAVKNVIALAVGMAEGLGFGDNTKATIITRGLAETARLGVAEGADALTFAGLSGMGDLIVTCESRHSRNRRVGERIAEGWTLEQITGSSPMVAEGILTTRSARDLAARNQVEMPIAEQVYRLLFEGADPRQAVTELMTREPKPERA